MAATTNNSKSINRKAQVILHDINNKKEIKIQSHALHRDKSDTISSTTTTNNVEILDLSEASFPEANNDTKTAHTHISVDASSSSSSSSARRAIHFAQAVNEDRREILDLQNYPSERLKWPECISAGEMLLP